MTVQNVFCGILQCSDFKTLFYRISVRLVLPKKRYHREPQLGKTAVIEPLISSNSVLTQISGVQGASSNISQLGVWMKLNGKLCCTISPNS